MPTADKTLGPFTGINNTSTQAAVSPKAAKATDNGYFDNDNAFVARPGHDVIDAGDVSCLYAFRGEPYYVKNGGLYRYGPSGPEFLGALPASTACIQDHGDVLHVSSAGALFGVVGTSLAPLAAPCPPAPQLDVASGALHDGVYGVALALSSPPSGLGEASWVAVPDGGGVEVTVPPGRYTVYATAGDGSAFYSVAEVTGPTSILIGETPAGFLCTVEFLSPPPAHDAIYSWNAYMLFRFGCIIHLSIQFSGGLCDARQYIPFPEPVAHVFPLPTGLFVQTTTRLYWLAGTDPEQLEVKEVLSGSGALDLGVVVDAKYVDPERAGKAAVGMIGGEFFAGFEDGSTRRLATQYLAPEPGAGKVSLVRVSTNQLLHFTTN